VSPSSSHPYIYAMRTLLAPRDPKTRNAIRHSGQGTPTYNSSRGSYRPISAIQATRTFGSLLRLGWIRHGTQIRSFKAIV
jgi:hypothetical protein